MKIINYLHGCLVEREMYKKMSYAHNPYGDGTASEKIINFLKKELK
jgi:UDP-N-acetylglucosamine 2-epimerase (non-hydrolysing)